MLVNDLDRRMISGCHASRNRRPIHVSCKGDGLLFLTLEWARNNPQIIISANTERIYEQFVENKFEPYVTGGHTVTL